MDKEIKKAIDVASEQAANKVADKVADKAAQQAVEAIKPYFDEKVKEVRHHFDVTKEQIISEIKTLGEGENLQDEKLEGHDKRIERLEDHAGLPVFEPAVEG